MFKNSRSTDHSDTHQTGVQIYLKVHELTSTSGDNHSTIRDMLKQYAYYDFTQGNTYPAIYQQR
jgi:hypothetical protein